MPIAPASSSLLAPLLHLLPFIVAAVSGAGALKVALMLLGHLASGRRDARACLAAVPLAALSVGVLYLTWRGFMASLAGSGTDPASASAPGASGLLGQLAPWGLALAPILGTMAVVVLHGPSATPGGTPSGARQAGGLSTREALGHVRRVKAELKGRKGEDAVIVTLARAGLPALHDVILPDALGLTQVDHLVRLHDGIAVLETKTYAGVVTGGVRDWEWVQHLQRGRVRTAFQNPLLQNHRHVEAVCGVAGADVPVRGLVVSAGSARFCAELKGVVVQVDDLAARLLDLPAGGCDPERLEVAWRELTAVAARSPSLRDAHLAQVRGRGAAAV